MDNPPLQRAAWARFHTARKHLDKTARDLHRHEEIDLPAYDAWLHRTFPVWVTRLRELYEEVAGKRYQVERVLSLSELTGRSLKKLWREQKESAAHPESFDEPSEDAADNSAARESDDSNDPFDAPPSRRPATTTTSRAAKEIYRRLVQHLHPDRGGVWSEKRKHLWHELQQAWAAGDADWLARLEIEWETANDVLTPDSALSRLLRAIDELVAARRDIERKLREYRQAPQWRFTLSEKKRSLLHAQTQENFRLDIGLLERQLAYLNSTIAAWEDRPQRNAARKAPARPYDARKRSWTDF